MIPTMDHPRWRQLGGIPRRIPRRKGPRSRWHRRRRRPNGRASWRNRGWYPLLETELVCFIIIQNKVFGFKRSRVNSFCVSCFLYHLLIKTSIWSSVRLIHQVRSIDSATRPEGLCQVERVNLLKKCCYDPVGDGPYLGTSLAGMYQSWRSPDGIGNPYVPV